MYSFIKFFNLYSFFISGGFLTGTVFGNATIGIAVGIFALSLIIMIVSFKD